MQECARLRHECTVLETAVLGGRGKRPENTEPDRLFARTLNAVHPLGKKWHPTAMRSADIKQSLVARSIATTSQDWLAQAFSQTDCGIVAVRGICRPPSCSPGCGKCGQDDGHVATSNGNHNKTNESAATPTLIHDNPRNDGHVSFGEPELHHAFLKRCRCAIPFP